MADRIYVWLDESGAIAEYAWGRDESDSRARGNYPAAWRAINPGWDRHPPFPWYEATLGAAGEVTRSLTRSDPRAVQMRAALARDMTADARSTFSALRAELADYAAAALPVPADLQARYDAARAAFVDACRRAVVE